VLDPRPFDADIETIAHLALELRGELFPEKRCDIIRLDLGLTV
jgi:GAF domain-containing protein